MGCCVIVVAYSKHCVWSIFNSQCDRLEASWFATYNSLARNSQLIASNSSNTRILHFADFFKYSRLANLFRIHHVPRKLGSNNDLFHVHLFWCHEEAVKCHCVKSFPVRSYSSPHFPAFGLLHIKSKYGKMRTRITWNTDTFYAMCEIGNIAS